MMIFQYPEITIIEKTVRNDVFQSISRKTDTQTIYCI